MWGMDMEDMDFVLIGAKMKRLRNEQGITQEQVAKDLGCTIGFVSNVENNRAKLNIKVLSYYSKICHVSIDSLLNVGEGSNSPDKREALLNEELLRVFRTFSLEEREKIIKMLQVWKEN